MDADLYHEKKTRSNSNSSTDSDSENEQKRSSNHRHDEKNGSTIVTNTTLNVTRLFGKYFSKYFFINSIRI